MTTQSTSRTVFHKGSECPRDGEFTALQTSSGTHSHLSMSVLYDNSTAGQDRLPASIIICCKLTTIFDVYDTCIQHKVVKILQDSQHPANNFVITCHVCCAVTTWGCLLFCYEHTGQIPTLCISIKYRVINLLNCWTIVVAVSFYFTVCACWFNRLRVNVKESTQPCW